MLTTHLKLPAYVLATEEVQDIFYSTFYDGGFNLSISEQHAFIKLIQLVPEYVDNLRVGRLFGGFVPFVLTLEDYMIEWKSLV